MAIKKEDLIYSKFLRYKRFIKDGTKLKSSYWFLECKCGAEYMRGMGLVHAKSLCITCTKTKASTKHGGQGTPEYCSWDCMIQRCTNPNNISYKNYGGRGIVVCDRWRDFRNFYADMGNRPEGTTLERIDNNKNYEPDNCKWATQYEQGRNKRNNRIVEYNGKKYCLTDLANKFGLKFDTLSSRLNLGWPIEKALHEPINQNTYDNFHGHRKVN